MVSPGVAMARQHGRVGGGARVRLHVRVLGAEQRLRALDGERLGDVDVLAAAVVAAAGVALGVLVREHGALRLQHRDGNEVLARDHLEVVALATELELEHLGDLGIDLGEGGIEDGLGQDWLLMTVRTKRGCCLVRLAPRGIRTGPGERSVRASRSPMVIHLNASRDARKHSNGCPAGCIVAHHVDRAAERGCRSAHRDRGRMGVGTCELGILPDRIRGRDAPTQHARARATLPVAGLAAVALVLTLGGCIAAPHENGAAVTGIIPAPTVVRAQRRPAVRPHRGVAARRRAARARPGSPRRSPHGAGLPRGSRCPSSRATPGHPTSHSSSPTASRPAVSPRGTRSRRAQHGVRIGADAAAGLFRGTQSLRQLLPAEIERADAAAPPDGGWTVPAASVADAPRFAYRGAMLDVARHFFPVEDVLALHRRHRAAQAQRAAPAPHRRPGLAHRDRRRGPSSPSIGAATSVGGDGGGFYTKADYRRIVAYAPSASSRSCPRSTCPGTRTPRSAPTPNSTATASPARPTRASRSASPRSAPRRARRGDLPVRRRRRRARSPR